MFKWFSKASLCVAFLDDVTTSEDLADSIWFKRGWTLQELIAPKEVSFYSQKWQLIGRKSDMAVQLAQITHVPASILRGTASLRSCSIAQRMSWAAGRHTEKLEDEAYSLLGIFGVPPTKIYGAGDQAFRLLQEEIIERHNDQSIFAWEHEFPVQSYDRRVQDHSTGHLDSSMDCPLHSRRTCSPFRQSTRHGAAVFFLLCHSCTVGSLFWSASTSIDELSITVSPIIGAFILSKFFRHSACHGIDLGYRFRLHCLLSSDLSSLFPLDSQLPSHLNWI